MIIFEQKSGREPWKITKSQNHKITKSQKQKFGSALKIQFEFARNPYFQAMNYF